MPRLARLRFVGIGHPRARMRDLTLDLRDPEGRATDSTLWLRNGGGKSSILNLFFALLRPGRAEFLGGKADAKQRRLEDYVLPDDHAVVVAEWQLDPDGLVERQDRFLTGVFYEYRTGGAPDESRLRRHFFCTHVANDEPGLTLEGLPLYTDGGTRRLTLAGFRQRWRELGESRGYLGVHQTENAGDWRALLDGVGLDPELFRYQIRMNTREGGADDVFRFSDGGQFVDFLVELVLAAELGDQVRKNIATWKDELRDRVQQLLPEKELSLGLSDRLAPLVAVAESRRDLTLACARERGRIDALVAWLAGEVGGERARLGDAEAKRKAFEAEASAARARAAAADRRAVTYRRAGARLRLSSVKAEREKLDEAYRIADRERAVWHAAGPLRDALRHEADALRRREELKARTADAEPLRRALEGAANRLAGALTRERKAAVAREVRAQGEATEAAALHRRATAEVATAHGDAVRAASAREEAERSLAEVERQRAKLEQEGTLLPRETGEAASARLATDRAAHEAEVRRLTDELSRLEEERGRLASDVTRANSRHADLGAQARSRREALEAAERRRAEFERDPVLQRVLEVETVDLDALPEGATDRLSTAARRLGEVILDLRASCAEDERAVASLASEGLLPASADARRVLAALAGLHAWTGWRWLAESVSPERRGEVARAVPAHVLGVVVRDADFAEAARRLREVGVAPDMPVTVVAASAFELNGGGNALVIGPASEALYDRAAGVQEQAVRQGRIEASRRKEHERASERQGLEKLHATLAAFRGQHPPGWFASEGQRLRSAEAEAALAGQRAAELQAQAQEVEARRRAADDAREKARGASSTVDERQRRLEAWRESHEARASAWTERRDRATVDESAARAREVEANARAESASLAHGEAQSRAAVAMAEARVFGERRARVPYATAEDDRGDSDLDGLEREVDDLRGQYEGKVDEKHLLALARASEDEGKAARRKLASRLIPGLNEDEVARALRSLLPGEDVDARYAEADSGRSSALGRRGQFGNQESQAQKALADAEEACARLGPLPDPTRSPRVSKPPPRSQWRLSLHPSGRSRRRRRRIVTRRPKKRERTHRAPD